MVPRLVSAALITVVLLSGCIGGSDAGPSATSPPVPTSTSEPLDPIEADLPPGVSESGVTNASALVAAHNQTLRTKGFVLNGTFVRDPPNAGNQTRRYHTVVGPEAQQFRTDVRTVRYATDDANASVTQRLRTQVWGNATTMIRQTTIDNQTVSSQIESLSPALSLTRAPQYTSYLAIGEFTVERVVARNDHTFTTLAATEPEDEFEENVTFNAQFVVDERGIIHAASVTVGAGPDSKTDHAEYRIVRLGASPQQPAWVTSTTPD